MLKKLIGGASLGGGILIGLYGVFAIGYGGDGGAGDTYVTLGGNRLDADAVGAVALLIAFAAVLASIALLGARWVFVGVAFGLAVPAFIVGTGLLSLDDPDGAAQAIGGLVIAAAAALALAGGVVLWLGRS